MSGRTQKIAESHGFFPESASFSTKFSETPKTLRQDQDRVDSAGGAKMKRSRTRSKSSKARGSRRNAGKRWVSSVKTGSTRPPSGLFNQSATKIANSLARKQVSPKGPGSGMRMLTYYINRGGKNLSSSPGHAGKSKSAAAQAHSQDRCMTKCRPFRLRWTRELRCLRGVPSPRCLYGRLAAGRPDQSHTCQPASCRCEVRSGWKARPDAKDEFRVSW